MREKTERKEKKYGVKDTKIRLYIEYRISIITLFRLVASKSFYKVMISHNSKSNYRFLLTFAFSKEVAKVTKV